MKTVCMAEIIRYRSDQFPSIGGAVRVVCCSSSGGADSECRDYKLIHSTECVEPSRECALIDLVLCVSKRTAS